MDSFLMSRVIDDSPKINPDIANGLAVKLQSRLEKYLDDIIRGVAKNFIEGLKYLGCKRCTPQEEYEFSIRPTSNTQNNKKTFDIARSDLYLVKFEFSYNGVMLPARKMYLPFIGDAGFMFISGSRFVISPVLSDVVISKGLNNIFIRLVRDKITVERLPHNVYINGVRESIQVVWSLIHHKIKKETNRSGVKANTSLAHYLFCKYGLAETFRRFAGCNVIIGESEINPNTYPPEDWTICSSVKLMPRGKDSSYIGTNIRLVFRNNEFNTLAKNLVAGFYYIVDHFPDRFRVDTLNDTTVWLITLGSILFITGTNSSQYVDAKEHLESLDEYMDEVVINKLHTINLFCTDIYQLFSIVILNFNDWVIQARDKVNSMYGKELSILYFLLEDITKAFIKLHYRLKKLANKKPSDGVSRKKLTERDITNAMMQILKPGIIFFIRKDNIGVSNVSYSGDNKYFEVTSILATQKSNAKKTSSNDKKDTTNPAKRLHVSIAEVGGYLSFTKSEPSGHSQINPYVKTRDLGEIVEIVRDTEKITLLDTVQEMIKRE
jgi:hypothetical protein